MILILFIYYILIITNNYINGSQCGNGTIPFSFEALEDGQPILGCAKATCLGWLPNGTYIGSNIKFWKMDGHPDGYLRSQNFKKDDIVIDNHSSKSIVKCEENFKSKHCGKSGEWVGGIKPLSYERLRNTTLKMKCCSYDKLLDSFDQGVGEINPGQIIVGGEIFKNGKQVAFEYIADIHKKIDNGRILYTVTTRRFKCGKGSNDDKQHIGRRKLKKINVVMKKKVNDEILNKEINNKIKKDKKIKNFNEIAFIKLLEEIQQTENIITRGKKYKNDRYKIKYKKHSKNKKDIRMSPQKNINLNIVEVNENNKNIKPRYQAYWDASENKWKYKKFVRSENQPKIDGDILFPSSDSIISQSYDENNNDNIPPIPVTVKPKKLKKNYETDIYVKIPKRTTKESQSPKTERLKLPVTTTFEPTTTSQITPQRTINWFGQQLVPGKTYKVYDSITPELSYEFTVPEILEPLATLPQSPSLPEILSHPLDIFNLLQSQSPSLDPTLRSFLSPSPQISSNIRRSPISHDIPISTTTTKRDTSSILQKPLSNIVIEQTNNKVSAISQKNINEIIPESGRLIFNKIAGTLLGEYYNRLML